MRQQPNLIIERYRKIHPTLGASPPGMNVGYFVIPCAGQYLNVISSGTDEEHGWEHVSVSTPHRCPTWDEMQCVKEMFWSDTETVIEFHPKKEKYINRMAYCLHLWKPIGVTIQLPPSECV